MAVKWQDFQSRKHLYPNLKYLTVGDDNVREQHSKLHGIILPIDHIFWLTHYPPSEWGCRCDVEQTDEEVNTNGLDINSIPKPSKIFSINTGIDRKIFDDNHPYFNVSKDFHLDIIQSVEKYKKFYPEYLKSENSKVLFSKWADKVEFEDNLSIAKLIAGKFNIDIKLEPHALIKGIKNPEYSFDGKFADRKSPEGLGLRNLLNKAKKQGCEIVIIDMANNSYSFEEMGEIIKRIIEKGSHKDIKEFYIVSKDQKNLKHYK